MKNFIIASTLCLSLLLPSIPLSAYAAESNAPQEQQLAELALSPNGTRGIVSMTFDDGNQATASWLNEIFKQYDLHGSIMMITDSNLKNTESISFWKSIFADGRLSPESHSRTHMVLPSDSWAAKNDPATLNNNTEENYIREIYESGDKIKTTFGSFPLCFAPSNNTMSEGGMRVVKKFYYAMRQGTRFGADIQSLDPIVGSHDPGGWYNLYMTGTKNKEDAILKGLNIAATDGGWLVIMCHGIGENSGDSTYAKFEPVLEQMSEAQKNGTVWVTTFSEATKYVRQRQNTSINLKQTAPGTYSLSLTLAEKTADGLPLSTEVFNLPLTVRINLPDGATHLAYRMGEDEVLVEGKTDEKGCYALLNMRADIDRATLRFTNKEGQSIFAADALTMKHSATYESAFTYTLYVKEDANVLRAKTADGEWVNASKLSVRVIDGERYLALPYTPTLDQAPKTFSVTLVTQGEESDGICTVSCSLLSYFDALLSSAEDEATEMLALNALVLLRDIANDRSISTDAQCVQDAIMKYHYRPKAPEEFATSQMDTSALHATLSFDLPYRPAIVLTPDAGISPTAYTFYDSDGALLVPLEEDGRLVLELKGTYAINEVTVKYEDGTSLTYSIGEDYARVQSSYTASTMYVSFYHTVQSLRKYLGAHPS